MTTDTKDLIARAANHLRQLAPHARTRDTAALLGETTTALERLTQQLKEAERDQRMCFACGVDLAVCNAKLTQPVPAAYINDQVLRAMHNDGRYGLCAPVPTDGGSTVPLYREPIGFVCETCQGGVIWKPFPHGLADGTQLYAAPPADPPAQTLDKVVERATLKDAGHDPQ